MTRTLIDGFRGAHASLSADWLQQRRHESIEGGVVCNLSRTLRSPLEGRGTSLYAMVKEWRGSPASIR